MIDFKAFKSGNEKALMDNFHMPTELFPDPLRTVESKMFGTVTYYDIPEFEKGKMLKIMYPFSPIPKMNEYYLDIHQDEKFRISDYMLIRDDEKNYLVSPYYPESGGMVVDWLEMPRSIDIDHYSLNKDYGKSTVNGPEGEEVEFYNMPDADRISLVRDVLEDYCKYKENGLFFDTKALRCFSWQDFKVETDEDSKGLATPLFEEGGAEFDDCVLIADGFCNDETLKVDTREVSSSVLPYSLHVLPLEEKNEFRPFPRELFEYIIPDKERKAVLESLFPFRPIPDFDSEVLDAYLGRKFFFRDCIVVRKHSRNVMLTPFLSDVGALSLLK